MVNVEASKRTDAELLNYDNFEKAIGLNFFEVDPNLDFILRRSLRDETELKLGRKIAHEFGEVVGKRVAKRAEVTDKAGPRLRSYDEWGYAKNDVIHDSSWIENKRDLVSIGLCDLATKNGQSIPASITSAAYYIVCQADTALMCALGMTSGAADIADRYAPIEVKDELVSRLKSSDPDYSFEGGMFLTERQGGSDVGANTLKAVQDGNEWRLFGDKHFCSNVDADIFVVLARPEGAQSGTRGLATFLVPRRLPDGSDNGFTIKRLKPKMGTVGVPTGEVHLEGTLAWLASPVPPSEDSGISEVERAKDGKGLNRMMEMVNGSRFGVGLMGLGIHRRSFLEAAIYAAHRKQFGNRIDSYPLVRETLVDLAVELEAGLAMSFEIVTSRNAPISMESAQRLGRIVIPLSKLRATRYGLYAASQALEIFGGNGYMEDWPMARQFRDAQCHPIWEGTENIICNDVRRAMRSVRAHDALYERVEVSIESATKVNMLDSLANSLNESLDNLKKIVAYVDHTKEDESLLASRRIAYRMADVFAGAMLLDEAVYSAKENDYRKALVANRFIRLHLKGGNDDLLMNADRSVIDLFNEITRYKQISQTDAKEVL